ncbi:DUF397 domain-containing protein [Streptosporangium amethystogenes subsp. fukuiense]|uniref:DUF397 domain-containing protein n=1 Tax=Streptosporangium amethystogenes subsp. fukuiense TaxID=698418 RepID=A0ABW2ST44_9ACTN
MSNRINRLQVDHPDEELLVLVRDSKDPEGPVLSFAPSEWDAFLGMIKGGEFADLS